MRPVDAISRDESSNLSGFALGNRIATSTEFDPCSNDSIGCPEALIRRASAEDIPALTQLRLDSLQETGALTNEVDLPTLADAISSFFERKIPREEFVAWVAVVGERIIATVGLVFFDRLPVPDCLSGMDAYVMNVYTAPEWRGRGISSMLLNDLLAFASDAGASRVRLHTSAKARGLYEGLGFLPKITEMELLL